MAPSGKKSLNKDCIILQLNGPGIQNCILMGFNGDIFVQKSLRGLCT